jgi:hypothetical protein
MTVLQNLNVSACQGDNAAIDSASYKRNVNSSVFNRPNSLYAVDV